jgi:hypothetical protein
MKLLRTIRLDASDTFIFPAAADPGEWAVPGAFMFFGVDPAALAGKERSAFRSGFLGIGSLAWSTLVQIVGVTPDVVTARKGAEEEIDFAASLCNHPADTLIAMHRSDEDGTIREIFRTLRPRRGPKPLRTFAFLETEGEDEPGDTVELATLARADPKYGDSG